MEYARPVLCRLCGFPAPDGGVPVSQVDREKLSEWCLRVMDTELDQEGLEEAVFCHFCVSDARFVQKPSIGATEREIFQNKIEDTLDKYISDGLIQRCAVRISNVPTEKEREEIVPLSTNTEQKSPANSKVLHCTYCSKTFSTKLVRNGHVTTSHSNVETYRCRLCFEFYKSTEEIDKHMKNYHKDNLKCCYCATNFEMFDQKVSHMMEVHKDICEKYQCRRICKNLFFFSETELQSHLNTVHYDPAKLKNCILCHDLVMSMSLHLKTRHRAVAVKCNFGDHCDTFFHSEEDMKKHLAQVHLLSKKESCTYCKKIIPSSHLKKHIKEKHRLSCSSNKQSAKYVYSEEDRQKHIQKVPRQEQSVIDIAASCVYCNKLVHWGKMTVHMEKHHNAEAIRCNISKRCPTYFLSEEERQKHSEEMHAKRTCHLCLKIVQGVRGLAVHNQIMHSNMQK